jgi:hypothetical protein
MLLIPSSAYNESVNSLLAMIRDDWRQSLKFETTRSVVMTKVNKNFINLDNKSDLIAIIDILQNSKESLDRTNKKR